MLVNAPQGKYKPQEKQTETVLKRCKNLFFLLNQSFIVAQVMVVGYFIKEKLNFLMFYKFSQFFLHQSVSAGGLGQLGSEYVFPSSGVPHDLFFRRWHLNFCLHFDVKSNHSNASLPLFSPYIQKTAEVRIQILMNLSKCTVPMSLMITINKLYIKTVF